MDHHLQIRLAALNIRLAAETPTHYLFTRDNLLVLMELATGTPGSTGILTESGIAYLIWRDNLPYLKSKTAETPAPPDQLAAMRQFSKDLQSALSRSPDLPT